MPVYPPLYTNQQIADQLTRSGNYWNKQVVTYSFNNSSTAGNALDATFQSWVNIAVQTVEDTLGIDFQLVTGTGNITFNGSRNDGTYASSSWSVPSNAYTSGKIYFDQTWDSNRSSDLSYGSYGLMTIIHEFLHTLGLDHPGEYNGSGSYFPDAPFRQDTHRYSVMSYFDANADGSGTSHWLKVNGSWEWQYAQTPMVYDLLALTDGAFAGYFAGYTPNSTTRAANTIYGYNATSGINSVFNFLVNDGPVLTIYDANGVDTLDLSGDTVATRRIVTYDAAGNSLTTDGVRTTTLIDLTPGSYSSTHGMSNNIGIAFGTIIENAIGSAFNDAITGNYADNGLSGGSGVDTISGGLGNDNIEGGAGGDILDGGDGFDTLNYAASNAAVRVNLGLNTATGGHATGDTVTNFEGVIGSAYNDILAGSTPMVGTFGGDGNDYIFAGFGQYVSGDNGADWFVFLDDQSGPASNGTIMDLRANDFIYLGGSTAAPVFSVSGANVTAGLINIAGGASANVSVIVQASSTLLNTANVPAINTVLSAGISGLSALGNYAVHTFDANGDESWRTRELRYTGSNQLDALLTSFDAGQPYFALLADYDQGNTENWTSLNTYYSAANVADFNWVYYEAGQPLYASTTNFDQASANNWSNLQTFYSAVNVTDYSYVNYDVGQPLFSAAVDYDQLASQTWSRIESFFSSAGVTDYYWTYYDAGQSSFAATVDYDQANAQTWSRLATFFSSSGVTDFSWTYYDAGQPLSARLVDQDQANVYAWSQHIVEYGAGGAVVNDYYV